MIINLDAFYALNGLLNHFVHLQRDILASLRLITYGGDPLLAEGASGELAAVLGVLKGHRLLSN